MRHLVEMLPTAGLGTMEGMSEGGKEGMVGRRHARLLNVCKEARQEPYTIVGGEQIATEAELKHLVHCCIKAEGKGRSWVMEGPVANQGPQLHKLRIYE